MSSTTLREGARWLVIGGLLGVGFVIPLFWWAAVVGIVISARQFVEVKSYRRLALGLLGAWWVKYLFALTWFWSTYPITWLPVAAEAPQRVLIVVYWFTAALWLALGALVVVGVWRLINRFAGAVSLYVRLAVLPLIWVWGEIFGSLFFSLLTNGPGGTANIKFSFGYLGYLLTEHATLMRLAEWGGVYILSVTIVCIGIGGYVLWQSRHGRWLVPAGLVLLLATSTLFTPALPVVSGDDYVVHAIDTTFPVRTVSTDETVRRTALQQAVEAAEASAPDYILLPEDARLVPPYQTIQEQRSQLRSDFPQLDAQLIDSGTIDGVLTAAVHVPKDGSYAVDKRYLVPQGEYTPTLYRLGLELFGQGSTVAYIEASRGYRLGDAQSQRALPATAPAILFCFESVDPLAVQTVVGEHAAAPFVAHIVSHSWFHTPEQLWQQLDRMLQVQAVWSDRYIVSAGNQVVGALYTPNGAIIRQTPIAEGDEWQVRAVRIPRSS